MTSKTAPSFNRRQQQLEWVRVGDLVVFWSDAQRELAEYKAREIADAFCPDVFGTLTVSTLPDGKYHVDDGWTRASAVRMLYGDNERVPCMVVRATTAAEAAEIFHKMNGGRSKPTAMQMFKVAVCANHPSECAVEALVHDLGLKVDLAGGDGSIRAVSALLSIYNQHGDEALRDTLVTIRTIWGLDNTGFDAQILRGVALFLTQSDATIDRTRLSKKVGRKFTPGRLVASAKATREAFGGSMSRAVCALIQETYAPTTRVRVAA